FEDIHWAAGSTRDFLSYLTRNLGNTHLLVLATYRVEAEREGDLSRLVVELERDPKVVTVRLKKFDLVETAEQVTRILGVPTDDKLVRAIHHRSSGNAFFVEELLRMAVAGGGADELP